VRKWGQDPHFRTRPIGTPLSFRHGSQGGHAALWAGQLTSRLGTLLTQNIPGGPWSAPVFIGQGEADEVIPFGLNKTYVAALCARHTDVDFRGYPGGTHMSILKTGTALGTDLVAWTENRLAGRPERAGCGQA